MTVIRDFGEGEYYHVFNRGTQKMPLFRDKNDWLRMLFSIIYLQSPVEIRNVSRIAPHGSTLEGFSIPLEIQERVSNSRYVEVVAFCIMPNHFHLLVREHKEGGIARYMQRLGAAYTAYFNTKYELSGHVFQGRYKTVHVEDNEQLLYLSSYIHRNPRELTAWKGKEEQYPFSSLQDYIDKNRWGDLLATDIIASQFEGTAQSNYRDFVRSSTAKELAEKIPVV